MSVTRRKDGRWCCRYYVDGRAKCEYFGRGLAGEKAAKERDAELKASGVIRGYTRHTIGVTGATFQDLALEYFAVKSQTDLAKSTIANLKYALERVILPELGHITAAGLTHKRLDDFAKKRLATPKTVNRGTMDKPRWVKLKNPDGTPQTISRSSVHRNLCDIQAILNWAVSKQYLMANPVIGHRKPKKEDDIIKPPTVAETRRILAQSAPHLIRALKLSFYTSLRPGAMELFRLTWGDVDFDAGTIFILSAKKGGLPYREVPLHDQLRRDMVDWYAEDGHDPGRHIITFQGQPVKSVKSAFKAAKRRAGIRRRMRMYDFRHAAASFMLAAGGDLKSVSEILGHSRTDTTTRVYQHTSIAMHRQQIGRLPGLDETEQEPENNVISLGKRKRGSGT